VARLSEALSEPPPRGTRLVLLEGAGDHFCFGASVPEHVREMAGKLIPEFHRLFAKLWGLSLPLAALVRGQCLGGGLELAAACDFLFVEDGAKLAVPEIKLGVFPPMASLVLPWRVGGARGFELVVTGRTLDASEAVSIGLATAKFEKGKGLDGVSEWVMKNLAPLSGSSLAFAVRAARSPLARTVERELPELERLYLEELMATHDANEGIAGFLERREPVWEHR
ncbi:MAG: enoyl-CoA hydratase/isomerase family protein, partial [Candidatus Wallbacteria bacterium]|nr:enoyl-CoA hydratase/isomerase family protein [Candidatus Wallbacteria bacterium]